MIYWKSLGDENFRIEPLVHINRGVYQISIPANRHDNKDFEFYVEMQTKNDILRYPPTAPELNSSIGVL